MWGLGLWTKRYRSGEIFRKLDRSANCRCSRQQRPIAVASSQTGGGQQRLKRGHSPWSCQSSVGHGHAYTAAGPFSFSGSIHFIDHRFRIARYSLQIIHLIDLSLELWTILWITSTIIPFAYRHFIWYNLEDFPIIQDVSRTAVFTGLHDCDTWSIRSFCNALLTFQGSRVRRYGSAVGPHRSLLKTFFSAIEQLHTSAFSVVEDHYRRHGSRRIGPHWSILKCRRVTASLETVHIFISEGFRLTFN